MFKGWNHPSKFIRRGTKVADDKNINHTASYHENEIYSDGWKKVYIF